jgi:hypothetical protein
MRRAVHCSLLSHRRLSLNEVVHRELPSHEVSLEDRHLRVHFEELATLEDVGVKR